MDEKDLTSSFSSQISTITHELGSYQFPINTVQQGCSYSQLPSSGLRTHHHSGDCHLQSGETRNTVYKILHICIISVIWLSIPLFVFLSHAGHKLIGEGGEKTHQLWRLQCSPAGSFYCCSARLFQCVCPQTSPCTWRSRSVTIVWRSTRPSAWGFATQGYVQREWFRKFI